MTVGCGRCIGCRLSHAAHWAARITHEATQWDNNHFLTLTYRDISQCTPEQLQNEQYLTSPSLNKKHLQKFLKRLRHHFPGNNIRYYACGEYGDQNDRPHFHLCIFNLPLTDEQLHSNNKNYPLFTSQTLEKIWGYGFITLGELTYDTAAYTARYVLKKITGPLAHDHYLRFDQYGVCYWLEPEFTTMSRGGKNGRGIGYDWINTYQDDVYPSDDLPIPGKGVIKGTPRYYDKILQEVDPKLYEKVQKNRQDYAKKNPLEFTPQRLQDKEKCTKALRQHIKRPL